MKEYEELVLQAKGRDVNAFAQLYELVYEDMYRMAFYMLGNAHDAEDVVSEAVLAAFESVHRLRSAAAFRGWIFKILLHQCKRKRKDYAQKALSVEANLEMSASAAHTGTQAGEVAKVLSEGTQTKGISAEERMDLKSAFLKLSGEERTILAMSMFGGYKSEEIGKYLHMNANTVRTKRSRALGKLHDML